MRFSLRALGWAMAFIALPTFSANDLSTNSPGDIRQSGLVYCISGLVNSFNPQTVSSGLTVDTLSAQLYNRLISVDPNTYQLTPELARQWQISDEGRTYRFTLRKGVSFQTTPWFTPHREFNAEDVVFSFQRVIDRQHPFYKVNGGRYPYFESLRFAENIESIKKLGDFQVEFRLRQPDTSFIWQLASYYAPILSAEYASQLSLQHQMAQIDHMPVGTGPFQLKEYRTGQFIRLLRHERYWQGQPSLPQVVIDMGAGGTGRLSKLLTGECDVLTNPAASQISILKHDKRFHVTQRPGMNVAYLAFNSQKNPTRDLRVRQAISMAINQPRLLQSIYFGAAEDAVSLLPRASWASDPDASKPPYDPEKAKALLAEAGYRSLKLELWVPIATHAYNPSPIKMAELLQADLAQIGIEIIIKQVDGRFQSERLNDMNHDLTLSGWVTDSTDPDSFLRPLLSCAAIQSHTNYAHWCNPDFDQLLNNARQSPLLAERSSDYLQAQQILQQALPVLPLATALHIQASRSDIQGLVLNSFGNGSFSRVYRVSTNDSQGKKP